ncbi:MAG: hypothetical protein AAF108_11430 [Planctomycetota bacterium]
MSRWHRVKTVGLGMHAWQQTRGKFVQSPRVREGSGSTEVVGDRLIDQAFRGGARVAVGQVVKQLEYPSDTQTQELCPVSKYPAIDIRRVEAQPGARSEQRTRLLIAGFEPDRLILITG